MITQSYPFSVQDEKRSTERVLLKIPIRVDGTGELSKPFTEDTWTVIINRNGAQIKLKNSVCAEDRITITNLRNRLSCLFRVVGPPGKPVSAGAEWSIECLEPGLNFWGILFPEKVAAKVVTPAEAEPMDALLECSGCGRRELMQLTMDQYRSISVQRSLRRECQRCGAIVEWKFGFDEVRLKNPPPAPLLHEQETSSQESVPSPAKRLSIKLPIRLRTQAGMEEVTRTENLSKTGVCFVSNQVLGVGDTVKLTVGYGSGKPETEICSRVVWRQQQIGLETSIYGVRIQEPLP